MLSQRKAGRTHLRLPTFCSGRVALFWAITCALVLGAPLTSLAAARLSESEIKAAYLFNFTRFVEWPPEAFSDAKAPIVIGVLGEDGFADLLRDSTAGKIVNGRAVVIRQLKEGSDLRSCNILFVSASERRYGPRIHEQLKNSTVLTVGDADLSVQSISIITFFVEENKLRLEIDLESASAARLKISSKIIAVSRIVDHRNKGKAL